jgi:hypothetical protein
VLRGAIGTLPAIVAAAAVSGPVLLLIGEALRETELEFAAAQTLSA